MPARRRAPKGCRISEMQFSMTVVRMFIEPVSRQQNVKLFLREPLALRICNRGQGSVPYWKSGLHLHRHSAAISRVVPVLQKE
jgi:hypothetical protein